MAKVSKRGRKAPPKARRKPFAPAKPVSPRKSSDAGLRQQLREARAQQAATAAILKVIARSPSNVQPVLDAIVSNVLRLLGATTAHVTRLEGGSLHLAAFSKTDASGAAALKRVYPMAASGLVAEPLSTRTAFVVEDAVQGHFPVLPLARGRRS